MFQNSFPNLNQNNFKITSPKSEEYNCIAWAYGVEDHWFWPNNDYYWPQNIKSEETVEAFIELFGSINYECCDSPLFENDYEKVAIYVLNGIPTHAARQLQNGKWTSKLGVEKDIEHDNLDCLNGPAYGIATVIMKRKNNAKRRF
jgi:hypothetical protein